MTRRTYIASRWQMGCPQERSRRSVGGETLGRSSVAGRRNRGRQLKKNITCLALKVGTPRLDAAAGAGSQGRCEGDEWPDVSVNDSPLNAMFRIRSVAVSPPEIHAVYVSFRARARRLKVALPAEKLFYPLTTRTRLRDGAEMNETRGFCAIDETQ